MERTIKPETLKSELAGMNILDVRRIADHTASTEQIAGANWHDPENSSSGPTACRRIRPSCFTVCAAAACPTASSMRCKPKA